MAHIILKIVSTSGKCEWTMEFKMLFRLLWFGAVIGVPKYIMQSHPGASENEKKNEKFGINSRGCGAAKRRSPLCVYVCERVIKLLSLNYSMLRFISACTCSMAHVHSSSFSTNIHATFRMCAVWRLRTDKQEFYWHSVNSHTFIYVVKSRMLSFSQNRRTFPKPSRK